LVKRASHRCIRILRPAARSYEEFGDTLGVLVNTRSNNADGHPEMSSQAGIRPVWRRMDSLIEPPTVECVRPAPSRGE
jgi:hypothetical protein